jgi:hypothetical protein
VDALLQTFNLSQHSATIRELLDAGIRNAAQGRAAEKYPCDADRLAVM